MENPIYNFSSGPSVLPRPVLEKAREELLSLEGSGMSVMEISHRPDAFGAILDSAELRLRRLLSVPSDYSILFLQGGASLQFSMIPLNFLPGGGSADYVLTGAWGVKAAAEAARCGNVRIAWTGDEDAFRSVPQPGEVRADPAAAYLHYTSNETIEGVEFDHDLEAGTIPVVCDASSNILSKPVDISKYSFLYAGAQKNIGPSGVTVVIISDEMLARVPAGQHSLLDYRKIAENRSMLNTPNTWGIYLIDLVLEWLESQGGVSSIKVMNEAKAKLLYDVIDSSDGFYAGHTARNARSKMNVTFRLGNDETTKLFCDEARSNGMVGLAGHRSVGGIRASIYNAFPKVGVEALAAFMNDFARRNG